jgi:MFS family permease
LLALVVVLLQTDSADEYELSVYAPYPTYFWGLVVTSIVIGQLVLLREARRRNPDRGNWLLGFLLAFIVDGILVFMPFIRGYPAYGLGDPLTHVGIVRDLQATADPFVTLYPSIHELVLVLSYATGMDPLFIINSVSGVIGLFSIGASYVLLSAIFAHRRVLLTFPFFFVLVGGSAHINPSPYVQSVLLFPFVFYLFVRAQQTESFPFRLALIMTLVALVIYHPLTTVFVLLVFLVHYAVVVLTGGESDAYRHSPISNVTSKNAIQLSVVMFLSWYYNFVGIIRRFETVIQRLIDPNSSESELDSYSSTISRYQPPLIDILSFAAVSFGQMILLLGIGFVSTLSTGWSYLRHRRVASPYLLTFSFGYVLFCVLSALFLVVNLIGGFGRPLMFAQFFGAFVAGTLLFELYAVTNRQTLVTTVALAILVGLVTISVVGLYASPMTGGSNHQVSEQYLDGTEWYLDAGLESTPLMERGIRLYRLEDVLNGSESEQIQQQGTLPPGQFNYTRHARFGESFDRPQYLVVTVRARLFYPTTYPDYENAWRFRPADYEHLENDPTVSHVYDNSEFDIYLIVPADEG